MCSTFRRRCSIVQAPTPPSPLRPKWVLQTSVEKVWRLEHFKHAESLFIHSMHWIDTTSLCKRLFSSLRCPTELYRSIPLCRCRSYPVVSNKEQAHYFPRGEKSTMSSFFDLNTWFMSLNFTKANLTSCGEAAGAWQSDATQQLGRNELI